MTVETTNSTISYTGNNSVATFAYNFLTYSEDHLFIYLDDVEQTSGFSITGIGDDSGGSVIFDVAPFSGVEVRIDRTVPETQLIEYQEYGPFKAKTNERGLDLGVMIGQQNARDTGRNSSKKMDKRTAAPEGNIVVFDEAGNSFDSGINITTVTGDYLEESKELSAGQLIVTFDVAEVVGSKISIGKRSGDGRALVIDDDYTALSNSTIELTESFEEGTICTVTENDVVGGHISVVRSTSAGEQISSYTALLPDSVVVEFDTGNTYKFNSSDLLSEVSVDSNSGYYVPPSSDITGASGAWVLLSGSLRANATIYVGASEQHTSINSLLSALENITGGSYSMEVVLQAGFVMAEQVLLYGSNLSWLTISSVDAEVAVSRIAITKELGSFDGSKPIFGGIGATLPVVDCMFRMDTSGSPIARQDGLFVENGKAIVRTGAGFQDFTEVGIYANSGSEIQAEGTNCSGSGVYGYFAFKGSSINCQDSTANNCGQYGLYVNRTSTGSANGSTFNNAGVNAVRAIRGSSVSWEDGVGTGSTEIGIYALNSQVFALRADVSNSGESGVYAHDAAVVGFRDGIANTCGGTASIWAFRGATIDADGASATGSTSATAAVLAQRASTINFHIADCSGSTATYGIRSSEGSTINAKESNAQKAGAPAVNDCSVEFGGTVVFNSGIGGTNVTVNTITSQGIIFG